MANPDGPRVDLLYPNDAELARLVKEHRDEKNGSSYKRLLAYYESRYGPLPPNHSMWNGEIGVNDSIGSGLLDGLKLGVNLYTGMQAFPTSGGAPTNATTTTNMPMPTNTRPPTGGGRILDILDRAGPYVDAFGRVADGVSRQRAEDRGAQAEYDVSRVPVANAQAMQHAQMKRQAEADRLRQISGADMLQNFQTPTDPRAQKFMGANGQLPGGQINPETLKLMRERSMKALESGSDVPQLQTMPDRPGGGPTGTDTLLGALNNSRTALGSLREAGIFGGRKIGRAHV